MGQYLYFIAVFLIGVLIPFIASKFTIKKTLNWSRNNVLKKIIVSEPLTYLIPLAILVITIGLALIVKQYIVTKIISFYGILLLVYGLGVVSSLFLPKKSRLN